MGSTNVWYVGYQRLVHKIPTLGTTNTNRWYCRYPTVIFIVPNGGIGLCLYRERYNTVKGSYNFGL
ncbi:MAG: hypothetical protein EGP63_08770 [Bacteroides stercoris]|nr:hypothetical protein [Bacteroides stercoris]